jgi:hypothetical protein
MRELKLKIETNLSLTHVSPSTQYEYAITMDKVSLDFRVQ